MRPRPLRVALSGGIATGKSYCLQQFVALGAPVVDADALAHAAIAPGSAGADDALKQFGTIDRKQLGELVFKDAAKRKALEAIIHPRVFEGIEQFFLRLKASAPFGIADIPLLFETGRERDYDRVIITNCRPEQQLERLRARGRSREDAERVIGLQMPFADKLSRAKAAEVPVDVIDTSGTTEETDRQVRRLIDVLGSLPPRVCP